MTNGLGLTGGLLGTVVGVGVTLLAMDILFNKRTGKYYHRKTGKEIPKEVAEKALKERDEKKLKSIFA